MSQARGRSRWGLPSFRKGTQRQAPRPGARQPHEYRDPKPHAGGAQPPVFPADAVPKHVALVMDGNGRWAKERGLARTDGHTAGEASLFDVVEGAAQIGVEYVSAYAFSTENWKRSPEEVRFLMGFNIETIHRRIDEMDDLGVRIRWCGRRPRLWKSVIRELEIAEERTKDNTRLTLAMCINYGGRAEIVDAASALAQDVRDGKIDPKKIDEKLFAAYLDEPDMPDVDLFIRSSGEQRTSNFLLWQSAYAEMVFDDVLWPDFDRTHMWKAVESYVARDRRYGGALPNVVTAAGTDAAAAEPAEAESAR
ncbi:isoprenyl transferase [Yinghuangia sp. KLBMP8922]|uniref:Isoprenyl transferase n=1 Tax=Yinghuangia soli TaxID=2908204 RepID=A0AA41U2D9_9ACTN|nr:isoprenyl transferase [Yinghuangia soli]MCF2530596.1 isoprenyl transferase [Yinghuangia soli]